MLFSIILHKNFKMKLFMKPSVFKCSLLNKNIFISFQQNISFDNKNNEKIKTPIITFSSLHASSPLQNLDSSLRDQPFHHPHKLPFKYFSSSVHKSQQYSFHTTRLIDWSSGHPSPTDSYQQRCTAQPQPHSLHHHLRRLFLNCIFVVTDRVWINTGWDASSVLQYPYYCMHAYSLN